jgi:hypothetical protein
MNFKFVTIIWKSVLQSCNSSKAHFILPEEGAIRSIQALMVTAFPQEKREKKGSSYYRNRQNTYIFIPLKLISSPNISFQAWI